LPPNGFIATWATESPHIGWNQRKLLGLSPCRPIKREYVEALDANLERYWFPVLASTQSLKPHTICVTIQVKLPYVEYMSLYERRLDHADVCDLFPGVQNVKVKLILAI
jgi:hypothetical protein